MNANSRTVSQLPDLPLWRLLVLLHDVERAVGPASETAIVLARAIRERMGTDEAVAPSTAPIGEDVRHD